MLNGRLPRKKTKIQLGYLWGISPRSTVKWYKVGESIGVYPAGVNEEGVKSAYTGQLRSKGLRRLAVHQARPEDLHRQQRRRHHAGETAQNRPEREHHHRRDHETGEQREHPLEHHVRGHGHAVVDMLMFGAEHHRVHRARERHGDAGDEPDDDHEPIVAKQAEPSVTVRGPVGELVMFVYGRQAHSSVEVSGDLGVGDHLRARALVVNGACRVGDNLIAGSLRLNDIPKAILVLQKAYEYIALSGAHESHPLVCLGLDADL